ncbi:hypothetical protein BH23GEM6_BH23GEM6_08970 [soil metagenome]
MPLLMALATFVSYPNLMLYIQRPFGCPRLTFTVVAAMELQMRRLIAGSISAVPVGGARIVADVVHPVSAVFTPAPSMYRVTRTTPAEGWALLDIRATIVASALLNFPNVASADELRPLCALARIRSLGTIIPLVAVPLTLRESRGRDQRACNGSNERQPCYRVADHESSSLLMVSSACLPQWQRRCQVVVPLNLSCIRYMLPSSVLDRGRSPDLRGDTTVGPTRTEYGSLPAGGDA